MLVDSILNKNAENEAIRKQILDDVLKKMQQDVEDQKVKNQVTIQKLMQMQKTGFVEAEKAIQDKKFIHQEIMKKGLDFLTEIELGNAPPLEYAIKNIQAQINSKTHVTTEAIVEQPIIKASDTVKSVQANLPREEERLKALMDDYAKTMLMLNQSN